jgi:hypothetical protein
MCKKSVRDSARECPTCRTDLGILLDYLGSLDTQLERAREKTQQGELGEAVWAYLEVLETDPDNPEARRQVGRIVTAVRMFDELSPGRRWLDFLRRRASLRRWWEDIRALNLRGWLTILGALLLLSTMTAIGYWQGYQGALDDISAVGPVPELGERRKERLPMPELIVPPKPPPMPKAKSTEKAPPPLMVPELLTP